MPLKGEARSRAMIEALQFLVGLAFWSWLLIIMSVIWWVTVVRLLIWCKDAGERLAAGKTLIQKVVKR